ncbi:hypothetical protein Ancab_037150 [Ancistrocladus abbreviatus]
MQKERQVRDMSKADPFDMFGGLGNFGGFGASIFGRNPFDDPFFTRPFGTLFTQSNIPGDSSQVLASKAPVIQEVHSEDEGEGKELENNMNDSKKSSNSSKEPFVHHPDDEADDDNYNNANQKIEGNRVKGTQTKTFKFHSRKVTYGGLDGAYYTSSATRRMGSDGMLMEECKEADTITGQATHRISRGIHDKGTSVARRLNSDGKVETLQTLHNLNEDELMGFEEAWEGNTGNHLPSWSDAFGTFENTGSDSSRLGQMSNWGRSLLPAAGHSTNESTAGRTKKVVRINIE